jgi:TusA-related sulfurtransferase
MAVGMAGFVDFEITWRKDVFSGAPQSGSAANFGTVGINFRARKAVDKAEWTATLAALNCEIPVSGQPQPRFNANAFYDAGDVGCAFGPIDEIAGLMRQMSPGQTLEVRATDATVAVDLPAWCRLAGHQLIAREGHRYLIRRQS